MAPTPKRFSCGHKICCMCSRSSHVFAPLVLQETPAPAATRTRCFAPHFRWSCFSCWALEGVPKSCPLSGWHVRSVGLCGPGVIRSPKRLQKHVFCEGFEGLAPGSAALMLQRNEPLNKVCGDSSFRTRLEGQASTAPLSPSKLPVSARFCTCMPSWRFPLDTQRGSEKLLCEESSGLRARFVNRTRS